MTSPVRRAMAFAAVGSLVVPVVAMAAVLPEATRPFVSAAPFLAIAGLALFVVDAGPLFELFARPGDRRDHRLYGLAGFSLAIGGLTLLVTRLGLPVEAFLAAILSVSIGPVAARAVHGSGHSARTTAAFVLGGASGAVLGTAIFESLVRAATGVSPLGTVPLPAIVFLGVVGALLAALLRVTLVDRDDPLVLVTVSLGLWVIASLPVATDPAIVAAGLAVSGLLGYLARRLETASVHGMVTGVLLTLLAVVLGDGQPGWILLLVTFFAVGGLSTKFKYDRKRRRNIAEDDEGARGSANVLANAAVATAALVGAAASQSAGVPTAPFVVAFGGSLATALGDTLSSEIGGLFDRPRLITTLEVVEPGTDGAITWQGECAGLAGSGLIAALAALTFPTVGPLSALLIVVAGLVGMTVDSLLGATIEGVLLENQGVNFLATASAGLFAGLLALL